MAFCKFCGAELEEGQTCTCPQAQAAAQPAAPVQPEAPVAPVPPEVPAVEPPVQNVVNEQPAVAPIASAAPAQPSKFGLMMKRFVELLGEFFKNPAQAIRAAVSEDQLIPAVILTAVRALFMGLLLLGVNVTLFGDIRSYLDVPGAGMFFLYGILMAVLTTGLFLVAVFCLSRITKSAVSFKAVFVANAFSGIWVTCLLVVAVLFSFVSLSFCVLLVLATATVAAASGVLTAQLLCQDNQSGKFWGVYLAFVLVVTILCTWIGYELLVKSTISGMLGGLGSLFF